MACYTHKLAIVYRDHRFCDVTSSYVYKVCCRTRNQCRYPFPRQALTLVINRTVRCHCFVPGPRLPPQLQSVNLYLGRYHSILLWWTCTGWAKKPDCFSDLITLWRLVLERRAVCQIFRNFIEKNVQNWHFNEFKYSLPNLLKSSQQLKLCYIWPEHRDFTQFTLTVKQLSFSHRVSPDETPRGHPLPCWPSSVFLVADRSLDSMCPGLAEPNSR